MNSREIFDFIEIIAATSSRNSKVELLRELCDEPEFRNVLKLTYNPHYIYNLKDVPEVTPGTRNFTEYTYLILDQLRSREISGNKALEIVTGELFELNRESQELFKRIIRKDLRGGISVKSINTAVEGLIEEFPYMRASLLKDVNLFRYDWSRGCYVQEKADGMFLNTTRLQDGSFKLTTRKGTLVPLEEFGDLKGRLEIDLDPGFQYHGEALVYRNGELLERKEGNGLINGTIKGSPFPADCELKLTFWDYVPYRFIRAKRDYCVPYYERFGFIKARIKENNVIDTWVVNSIESAEAIFERLHREGKEGVIVKDPRMKWTDGTSKEMFKLKAEKTADLRVFGLNEGTGKYVGKLGSLVAGTDEGSLLVNVSGFTDEQREEFWKNPDLVNGKIVEVKYNAIIRKKASDVYSLYLPVFIEVRYDKDIADTIERLV